MPIIGSSLPFNQLGAAGAAMAPVYGGNPQQSLGALGPALAAGYGAMASFNMANHGDIEKGFQQTAQQMQDEQTKIDSGFGLLRQDVRDQLAGYGRSAENDLNSQYAQARGAAGQSLISRGLGNSTIADSVQRGLGYDRARAGIDLGDRLTAQRVGFDAALGQGQLGFQERASGANAGLAQNQLSWMNSINAPYPNGALFGQLASMFGSQQQAGLDREQVNRLGGAAIGAANRPQAGPVSMGGGSGFFRPGAGEGMAGLGGEAPFIGGGMAAMRRFAPPLGAVASQAQGDAAAAYFGGGGSGFASGFASPYAPPTGGGFGGGFGDQGYGYSPPAGEDQPFGQPQPGMAVQPGGYSPYGSGATTAYSNPWAGGSLGGGSPYSPYSPWGGGNPASNAAGSVFGGGALGVPQSSYGNYGGYDLSNEDLPYGGY